jgi:3-hydroxybutyryl-CoA dehydrogenase
MTIERIGIVGAGGMGRGIAEVAALAGLPTVLVKATPGDPGAVSRQIAASLDRAVEKKRVDAATASSALARLQVTSDFEALAACDIVVESVIETLDDKRRVLGAIERHLAPPTILASNTSSLPLPALADSLRAPANFVGLHFFSPVPLMKLVEVASTQRTYPRAVEGAQAFVERIGKTPVLVGESSGYIVNRLLVPYLLDGLSALESHVASAPTIDLAMKLGCGHPMGPLALADAIGLDVVYAMAKALHKELGPRYTPPALLRGLVLRGQLGKKTGLGVYDYSVTPPVENPALQPVAA